MQPYRWDQSADDLWLLHRGQPLEEADKQSWLPATHTVLPVERTGWRALLEGGRGGVFSQPSPKELLQHTSSLLVHHLSSCAGCRTCQCWVVVLGSFPKLCGISGKLRIFGKTILQDKIMHIFFYIKSSLLFLLPHTYMYVHTLHITVFQSTTGNKKDVRTSQDEVTSTFLYWNGSGLPDMQVGQLPPLRLKRC